MPSKRGHITGAARLLIFCTLIAVGLFCLRKFKADQTRADTELPLRFEPGRQPVKLALDDGAFHISRGEAATSLSNLALMKTGVDLKAKAYESSRIAPLETTIWRVRATVDDLQRNGDGDLLLTLSDHGTRMRAEVPFPDFVKSSAFASGVGDLWKELVSECKPGDKPSRIGREALLSGIGFYDPLQPVSERVELHPLIKVRWLQK